MAELVRNKKLLDVKDLKVYFYTDKGTSKAVDGNSFRMYENETLAIVGESGCGKSVTAMSILGLVDKPGKIVEGSQIEYDGKNLVTMKEDELRKVRGNEISMIFQEPMTSLNPVFKIGKQITETILLHEDVTKEEAMKRAVDMLGLVGISRPEKVVNDYPHQLSGGMRQRVMIAMALACDPKLLIADEPTTALDVTIQAQILSLMNDLKKKTGTSIMLITHDLGVVAQMADNVNVMYAGKVVETAPVKELFNNPKHPYTKGLMQSMPSLNMDGNRLNTIEGNVPNALYLPKGCYFADRCPHVMDKCRENQPPTCKIKSRHHVSCFLYEDEDLNKKEVE
ncbi:ABC transporter ATP-binding protein [Breznakia pachnodae]|uniref:Peptide/nickel transport system ATP-binding protein n=1 Tax=Breznakia pachnodae TaxID=265178 RepID=A0ABU0E3A8_9FIRM|nr:ABC transporter ATP-binding protein [Breznakia pachnodae]MDQ0361375.1 peptide/nickel transport system ATP-binding protein [Breznakia pachnodae]